MTVSPRSPYLYVCWSFPTAPRTLNHFSHRRGCNSDSFLELLCSFFLYLIICFWIITPASPHKLLSQNQHALTVISAISFKCF